MNRIRSASLASLGALALVAAACTAGTGPASLGFPPARESAPNDRQTPGPAREPPGATRDNPGNDRQSPGDVRDAPPGGATGAGACPACDTTYACTAVSNGVSVSFTIKLQTQKTGCILVNQGLRLDCNGKLVPTTSDGVEIPWTAYGKGGFSAPGKDGSTIACVPGATDSSGDDDDTSGSGGDDSSG